MKHTQNPIPYILIWMFSRTHTHTHTSVFHNMRHDMIREAFTGRTITKERNQRTINYDYYLFVFYSYNLSLSLMSVTTPPPTASFSISVLLSIHPPSPSPSRPPHTYSLFPLVRHVPLNPIIVSEYSFGGPLLSFICDRSNNSKPNSIHIVCCILYGNVNVCMFDVDDVVKLWFSSVFLWFSNLYCCYSNQLLHYRKYETWLWIYICM